MCLQYYIILSVSNTTVVLYVLITVEEEEVLTVPVEAVDNGQYYTQLVTGLIH